MADSDRLREKALKCRELAAEADHGTAANLRMLADEYEEQARKLDGEPRPRPVERRKP